LLGTNKFVSNGKKKGKHDQQGKRKLYQRLRNGIFPEPYFGKVENADLVPFEPQHAPIQRTSEHHTGRDGADAHPAIAGTGKLRAGQTDGARTSPAEGRLRAHRNRTGTRRYLGTDARLGREAQGNG